MAEEARNEHEPKRDWHDIAKEITEEKDGKKIAQLSEELVRALDKPRKSTGAA